MSTAFFWVLRRLAGALAALVGASLVVFIVLEVLPGDPARVILGMEASQSSVEALRAELGLDRPAITRYGDWVAGLATGDLGKSYTYNVPVSELVGERLVLTLPLASMAMIMAALIGMAAGVYAASHHNRLGDWGVMGLSQLGIAVPNFWLALLMILFFAVHLGWFSAGGFPGWQDGALAALKSLLLPALSLALVQASIIARVTRSTMLEVINEDFVRTARAKGNTRRRTLYVHVLRNALIPVVTILGLQFANLLAGTIIVENVFYLPGLGRLVFQAITQRDLTVVKNVVVLLAGAVILINLVVDLTYFVIDPRLRARS